MDRRVARQRGLPLPGADLKPARGLRRLDLHRLRIRKGAIDPDPHLDLAAPGALRHFDDDPARRPGPDRGRQAVDEDAPGAVLAVEVDAFCAGIGVLPRGKAATNTLSDGTYIDVYVYEGVAGETVTIVLESDDFDAFLMVFAEDDSLLAEDDDSAGGTNATLTLTLPYTGIYFVVAKSFYWGDQGSYTVTLTRGNPTP